MTKTPIAAAFMEIVERVGRKFGIPLPKKMLEIGHDQKGWGVRLNPTAAKIDDLDPFTAGVTWNGFPAGFIDPHGGIIAAGEAANEQTLREWLRSDLPVGVTNG